MSKNGSGDRRQSLALAGEEAAGSFLQDLGMRIVARRYRCRAGEIDLILQDGEVLVFAEVKTRKSTRCGRPWEAVDHRKIRKIATVAAWYLAAHRQSGRACRFDVVEVLGIGPKNFRIRHFPDAFRL
jgi:putative endonuclease